MGDTNAASATTAVVFTGPGSEDLPSRLVGALVPPGAHVIAADSGLHLADAAGVGVQEVIGDLDSVAPDVLGRAVAAGAVVDRHPAAKDQTDLELALERAARLRPRRIVVIGGAGGRLDHLAANLSVLAADAYAAFTIEAHMGPARVDVVRDRVALRGEIGDLVTLLPMHGPARGVETEGLRYPLRDETLDSGSTRGVSNEHTATLASVRLTSGVLLAIAPDRHAPDPRPHPREDI
jgi:thiamine pyrophosphokinase